MLPEGFEPVTPVRERPQTHALDRSAIRIDLGNTSRGYIAWIAICRGYVFLISVCCWILIRSENNTGTMQDINM